MNNTHETDSLPQDPNPPAQVEDVIETDDGTRYRIRLPKLTEPEWLGYHCGTDNLSGYAEDSR